MLPIQDFLKSGKTLSDVHQKYDIDYNISDELGVVVFNYRMLSPMDDLLVRQTRGLVLEVGTWNVVSKSIDAFFEPNNPFGKETLENFDWETAQAVEKLDGALVTLYYYKDAWRVCTRFSPDGHWIVWSMNSAPSNFTWLEYVKRTLLDMGTDWENFTSQLNPKIFYTFEICGPENRVVVVYPERFITLVAALDSETLKELDIFKLDLNCKRPEPIKVHSLDDCWNLVEANKNPYEHEGFIVFDKDFRRLKIRNPEHQAVFQTYNIQDDVSALRELRKLDTSGSYTTTITTTSTVFTTGSCHAMNTKIDVAGGKKEIADLSVGDWICGRSDRMQQITSILEGFEAIFEVKHEAGVTFCSGSHPLFLSDGKNCVSAEKLKKGNKLYLFGGMASKVISVTLTKRREVVRLLEVYPDHEYIADNLLMHNFSLTGTVKTAFGGSSVMDLFFARALELSRWTSDQYQAKLESATEASTDVDEIWPEAIEKLREGKNMSQILDTSPEEEIIEAMKKYEAMKSKKEKSSLKETEE